MGKPAVDSVRDQLAVGSDGGLKIGSAQTVAGLTLLPLFHHARSIEYDVLAEAQKAGTLTVTEIDASGSVPALAAKNSAGLPVLMIEGEILTGLKQNRVLNITILVPAGATVEIPVSCVEAGRWRRESAAAGRARYSLSAKIRAGKLAAVARSARSIGDFLSDQARVWGDVDLSLDAHKVRTRTKAYSEIHQVRGREIDKFVRQLTPSPNQTGVLALLNGEPLSLDLFDRPSTLALAWEELVGSYATEALVAEGEGTSIDDAKPVNWIRGLLEGEATSHPAVGLGETVFITSPHHTVGALVVDGVPVHIAAWPA